MKSIIGSLLLLIIICKQGYSQNTYPSSGTAFISSLDLHFSRNANSASDGLNLGVSDYTNFQFAYDTWSGTHALLFNAYKTSGNPSGGLNVNGNTQYANDVGAYSSGAGSIMFFGNGGSMGFYISPISTGKDSSIEWGTPKMTIKRTGNVGIGTSSPDQKLTVKGKIHSEEIIVDLNVPGPDYVFEPDYNLTTLAELEDFIQANKHLPEIPSAAIMEEEGIVLGEMNMLLLKKIEELTLYVIEQEKRIQQLEEKEND